MTAPPAKLPRDLQGRLDVILAKPVLRRCPMLRDAISVLVRSAYERRPVPQDLPDSLGMDADKAREILDWFDQAYPALAAFREQLTASEHRDGVL